MYLILGDLDVCFTSIRNLIPTLFVMNNFFKFSENEILSSYLDSIFEQASRLRGFSLVIHCKMLKIMALRALPFHNNLYWDIQSRPETLESKISVSSV